MEKIPQFESDDPLERLRDNLNIYSEVGARIEEDTIRFSIPESHLLLDRIDNLSDEYEITKTPREAITDSEPSHAMIDIQIRIKK